MTWPALPASPVATARAWLATTWRRWRCTHPAWCPACGCQDCGKDPQ